jgi:putative peptidoglycan lipid II flippase
LRRFSGAVVGRGVVQLSALVDLLLAATLVSGAVTALSKAQVLYIMPISLFAVSIAASELPELSRMTSNEAIRQRAQAGFGRILFFISFTTVAYILLGDKIIATIFEYGRFTSDDTLLIWFALATYSLGLIPSALSRLTQNTLWSRGDTAGPARIAIVRVMISIAFAAALMGLFDRLGTTDVRDALPTLYDEGGRNENLRFGAMGITLGSAIGAWVEGLLLWRLAGRTVPGVSPFAPLQRLLPALGASAVVAIGMRFVTDDMWPPLAAFLSVGLSGLTFVGICWLRRVPEVDLILAGPLRRLRRGDTNAR